MVNFSEAFEKVGPAIVQIDYIATRVSEIQEKQVDIPLYKKLLGTSFFVSAEGHVITAYHVIKDGLELDEQIIAHKKGLLIGISLPDSELFRGNHTLVEFSIVGTDELHDIALLKLNKNPFRGEIKSGISISGKPLPLNVGVVDIEIKRPKDGVPIVISGYPLGNYVKVSNAGHVASSWNVEITELINPELPIGAGRFEISEAYLVDAETNPGNSGSPVYLTKSASVIGLCTAGRLAPVWQQTEVQKKLDIALEGGPQLLVNSGLTVVIPSRYIITLLEQHRIPWNRFE